MSLRFTQKPPLRVIWGFVASPAGKLMVGLTDKGELCRVSFLKGQSAKASLENWRALWPQTEFIQRVFIKTNKTNILLVGTGFQQAVWRGMAKIPSGKTITYGELAQKIGRAGAARAVGAACGANPVPYFIPCHRVVSAQGLGGFSGGKGIKEILLKAEGVSFNYTYRRSRIGKPCPEEDIRTSL